MKRIEIRKVRPEDLRAIEEVLQQGFAGHTIDQFPEPARSYHILYARLEPFRERERLPVTPLLMDLPDGRRGLTNTVWSARVGLVLASRVGETTYELQERVTLVTDPHLIQGIRFIDNEIVITFPIF